jgi:hypothetical protein
MSHKQPNPDPPAAGARDPAREQLAHDALNTVIEALKPLPDEARARVAKSVLILFNLYVGQ